MSAIFANQIHQEVIEQPDCESSTATNAMQRRAELEAQIAEYLARGGKVNELPSGILAITNGKVIVGEAPDSIGTPRPVKPQITDMNLVSIGATAKLLGKSSTFITNRVKSGELKIVATDNKTKAKLLLRADVLALANTTTEQHHE